MIAVWMRTGMVLIIVVVHIALLFLLSFRQRRESTAETSMHLVLIPQRAVPKATTPESESLPAQRTKPIRAAQKSTPASPEEAQSPAPSIDWHASAAVAVSGAIAKHLREEGYRNFGVPKRAPAEPAEPSIFVAPKHSAGDIDNDQRNGVTRVYHSEHCFTQLDFPTLKDPGDELKPKINLPRCMYDVGKADADGDLFRHLKKEQPLPDLKTGTQLRQD
jgi:hypothetical protein